MANITCARFAVTDFPRSLIEFQRRFPDEAACASYLAAARWARRLSLSALRPRQGLATGEQGLHLGVRRLRQADVGFGYRRNGTARLQAAAHGLALGGVSDGHAFPTVIAALQVQKQLGLGSCKSAWLLCAKLRRVLVALNRFALSGLVEIDETVIPFRRKGSIRRAALEVNDGRPRPASPGADRRLLRHEPARLRQSRPP